MKASSIKALILKVGLLVLTGGACPQHANSSSSSSVGVGQKTNRLCAESMGQFNQRKPGLPFSGLQIKKEVRL
jgi:hypothetical protein